MGTDEVLRRGEIDQREIALGMLDRLELVF